MFSAHAFDNIDLLSRAANYSWKRETILANNLANADTPTYKRKDIDFSRVLLDEMVKTGVASGTENAGMIVRQMEPEQVVAPVYVDYEDFSYRIDMNNVDPDTENVELASEQLRYQMLTSSMSHEFGLMRTAMQGR